MCKHGWAEYARALAVGARPDLAGCSERRIEWPGVTTRLDLGGHGSFG